MSVNSPASIMEGKQLDDDVQMRLDSALSGDPLASGPPEPRLYSNFVPDKVDDIAPSNPVLDEDERERRARRTARFGQSAEGVDGEAGVSAVATEQKDDDNIPAAPSVASLQELRTSALFLTSSSIQTLDTASILRFVNSLLDAHLRAKFNGIEWIDDTKLCLRFASYTDAANGFARLLRQPISDEDIQQVVSFLEYIDSMVADNPDYTDFDVDLLDPLLQYRQAHPFPAYILAQSQHTSDPFGPAPSPSYVRFATKSDIKERGAASKSKWYAQEGIMAGRMIHPLPNQGGKHRSRPSPQALERRAKILSTELGARMGGKVRKRDERIKDDLDAELDALHNDSDMVDRNDFSFNSTVSFANDDLDEDVLAAETRKQNVASRMNEGTAGIWDIPLKKDELGDFGDDDGNLKTTSGEQEESSGIMETFQQDSYTEDAAESHEQAQERATPPSLLERMRPSAADFMSRIEKR